MANPELVRKLSPATKKGILVTEAKQGQLATSELVDLADLLATDPADRATMTQAALEALVAGGMPAGRVADLRKAFATSSGASTPTPTAPPIAPPAIPPVAPPPVPPAVPASQAAADALAKSAASQQTRPVQPAFKVPFDNQPSITTRAEEAGTTESAIMEWSDLQNELQKAAEPEQAPPPQEPPATPEPPAPKAPAPPAPKAPAPLRGAAAQLMKQPPPPAAPHPPPPPPAPPQDTQRSSVEPMIRRDTLHFGNEPASIASASQADGNRPVVLIADDDNRIRMVFRLKLEQKGFRVVEAEDGAEAWKRLQQGGISAVVLDMKMPGLHGLEVLQRLSDGKQELPVVICTAYDNLDDEFVVATYPKLRYLTKPVDADQLAATLVNLLAEGNA